MSPFHLAEYDPSTPEEIARADALDAQDLAAGRDFHGAAEACRPATTFTRADRVALLTSRADEQLALFHRAGDAIHLHPSDPQFLPRDRRPSEVARSRSFRDEDAARKRADRARKRAEDAV